MKSPGRDGRKHGGRAQAPFVPDGTWNLGGRKPTAKAVGYFQKIFFAGTAMPMRLLRSVGMKQINIPKGLRHSAQRCRDAGTATLGNGAQSLSTLKELQQTAAGR